MVSPFVRRRRLAAELRALREEREMTADELAKRIHYSRMKVSRLENAHGRPDVGDVITILNTLGVSDKKWKEIITLAHEAAAKGWWDSYGEAMGTRQRLYADVESGASTIRGYSPSSIPGVLQTPEMIAAMVNLAEAEGSTDFMPAKMTKARLRRQEEILRPDGPAYDFILDEVVLHRVIVPEEVLAAQVRHIVRAVTEVDHLNVRLLPVDVRTPGYPLPTVPFFLYTFPEPEDPPMTLVDTVTTDIVHTDPQDVERYTRRYDHLSRAALSPEASLSLLDEVADRLTEETGPRA
ncbi:helix-turn-helix domain-containing protein [Actinomadura opuntiae]|uniref:helix-turn-helix domain-containing protein n=1 Tax=Actinomadura sp. OS1-43 TaxID=604315 RepID=UPI00255A9AFA|nr:Scr1 family TA system antitoxin-like transcriptional regulator [Actinomadura sp. OS1-43]MDL4820780.1 Scr1 family TA system antitoxin-like transcriptional regulator [Actinomadura sp. OS1-43]